MRRWSRRTYCYNADMSQAEPALRKPDLLGAIVQAVMAFLRSVLRAAHALWLEVTGFLFLVIGVFLSYGVWREYQRWTAGGEPWRVLLAGAFAAMFLYFGMNSIWRARRHHG